MNAETNQSRQPDQDKIAQLAAIVFSACAGKQLPANPKIKHSSPREITREEEAVRVASRLWLHAGEYCEKLTNALSSPKHDTPWSQPWSVVGDDQKAELAITLAEWDEPQQTLPALEITLVWLKKNAPAKADQKLSLAMLKQEWAKFGKGPNLMIPVKVLKEFVRWRSEQRSLARSERRIRAQEKSKKKPAQFKRHLASSARQNRAKAHKRADK